MNNLMNQGANLGEIEWPADDFDAEASGPADTRTTFQKISEGQTFTEPCKKCRGRGFVTFGYFNQRSGQCFACKGTGTKTFKTSPEQRAKATAAKERREAREAAAHAEWLANDPVGRELEAAASWSEFAANLIEAHRKYGHLTDRQQAAAESMAAKLAARRAEKAQAEAQAVASSKGIDLSHIPSGHYAIPGGDSRLKVKIDNVKDGKWAGFVFVKDGAEYGAGQRYGTQKPGATYAGKIEDALAIIAADPKAASAAYGRLVGRCGVCGRRLEDEASVAAGIGPICAQKF